MLYYHDSKGTLVSVPARWTDTVPSDPVVTVSAGRSPFRLAPYLAFFTRATVARPQVEFQRQLGQLC